MGLGGGGGDVWGVGIQELLVVCVCGGGGGVCGDGEGLSGWCSRCRKGGGGSRRFRG